MSDDDFAPLPCPDCGSAGSCHCYAKRLGEKLESAEADVKALRARIAELEAQLKECDERYCTAADAVAQCCEDNASRAEKAEAEVARLRRRELERRYEKVYATLREKLAAYDKTPTHPKEED